MVYENALCLAADILRLAAEGESGDSCTEEPACTVAGSYAAT
jgi:hypothetical protein